MLALYLRSFGLSYLAIAAIGCSEGPPPKPQGVAVEGKVLLPNGKPLTGGTLVLRPESGLYGATALIQPDGSFSLKETSGIASTVPGRYQVFVSFPNPIHDPLRASVAAKYQKSEDGDSDVFVDVTSQEPMLQIRLKR